MTLTEFLLQRIAEVEATAEHAREGLAAMNAHALQVMGREVYDPARVLAECAAKRRIVELHEPNGETCSVCALQDGSKYGDGWGAEDWPCSTLRALALPYADHEAFREEWR